MTPEQIELLEKARQAAEFAHAPYSRYRVGAAVLTSEGVLIGANIENACANLGVCAERVALAHARMNGQRDIRGIAIWCLDVSRDADGRAREHEAIPCGGCRQWLAELASEAWIVTNTSKNEYVLKDLLPFPFHMPDIP